MASWVGDSIEEFKKAPTGGKIALVAIFVLVGGIGFYEYNKSKSSTSGVSGQASPSTDTTGGGANNPYPVVPGSGQGQVPVLPGGFSALFDPLGNLIGWQPTPTPSPVSPTPAPKPGTRGGRLPHVPTPTPTQKGKEPEPGTDVGRHRDTQAGRDVGNNHSHMNNRVQPPTGTERGSKPGPGQQSRPVPAQPTGRRLPHT